MRTALITGASSGIGFALALELGRRNYRIALLARRQDLLEELAGKLREQGSDALTFACDVTDKQAVKSAVADVMSSWGGIDLAVANAGVGVPTYAHRFVLEDAEQIMNVNFFGMLYLFDAVIPGMIERRSGRFAGIASLAGLRGLPASSMYSTSKAAMQTFLEAVRIELAPRGVGVTTVNPGFIVTPMTAKNKFRMPFLWPVDRAARVIADGLERGARQIEFPFGTSLMMRAARLLPAAVYDRIVGGAARRGVGK